jgi:hypothetical protein
MIPKKIHLCWLSGDAYPPKIARCIESWKMILPDYEIVLWDTKRFDLNQSAWVREAFKKKKYAFAADYIRFYALYHEGGIYLDSDVEVLKRFDDLLDLPYFMGAEKAGTPEAAIIGAEKGCDWIKKCLDYYEERHFIKEDETLDIRKLPEIMDEQIRKLKPLRILSLIESQKIRTLDFQKEVLVMNDAYFSPKIFDSRKVELTPYTYAIHHYQNSWFSPKAKAYYRFRTFLIRVFGFNIVCKVERKLMPWRFSK